MNSELEIVDFKYDRIKPGKITGWEKYNITGKALGFKKNNSRIQIKSIINKTYIKPSYGIDKISIVLPREFINENVYFYNTDLLTFNHTGQYTKLHFHAECLFFDEEYMTIKDNIVFYLKYLIKCGFLQIPIFYHNERTCKTYSNENKHWYDKLPENMDEVFNIIIECMKISEIEIFFDFKCNILRFFDRSNYINVKKTLYSKDYICLANHKQKSLICIYDKGLCLGIKDDLYRLEYRLTGKYLRKCSLINEKRHQIHRYNLDSFNYSIDDFIKINEKYLGILSNKLLNYNFGFIGIVDNNCLYRILTEYREYKKYRKCL